MSGSAGSDGNMYQVCFGARPRGTDEVRPALSRAGPPAANCLHPYGPLGVTHPGESSPRISYSRALSRCAPPSLTRGVLSCEGLCLAQVDTCRGCCSYSVEAVMCAELSFS